MQGGAEHRERKLRRHRDRQRFCRVADVVRRTHRGRFVQISVDVARGSVEYQRGIGDGAGQHAVDGDAVEGLGQWPSRDPAALRLDPDEVRPCGGDADAARPSEPIAAVTKPAATAAALPPEEPPGVCSRDHGLRVWPKAGPLVNGHCPSSHVLVLPTMTAPAARSRRTTSASAVAARLRTTCRTVSVPPPRRRHP